MKSIRTRIAVSVAVVTLLAGVAASALFRDSPRPEEKAKRLDPEALASIRKASNVYAAAFNKGDVDGLMALWTADADYVNADGKAFHGRGAIAAEFKRMAAAAKGSRVNFRTTSLRFPRPDVAVEDGVARTVTASGEASTNRYTAVWVRNDGKWLLSSAHELPGDDEEKTGAASQLKQLAWLVGEWAGEGSHGETRFVCHWAPNQSFLVIDYTIHRAGGEVAQVEQRIGWDPASQSLRSWVFDSSGGFGEGIWTREGNRWTVNAQGTLPDGRGGSGVYVYQFADDGRFTWEAKDRQIDGQPVADVRVKFTRKTDNTNKK